MECSICLSSIKNSRKYELSCGHIFHKKCIDRWYEIKKDNICPYCKNKDINIDMILIATRILNKNKLTDLGSYVKLAENMAVKHIFRNRSRKNVKMILQNNDIVLKFKNSSIFCKNRDNYIFNRIILFNRYILISFVKESDKICELMLFKHNIQTRYRDHLSTIRSGIDNIVNTTYV